MKWILKEKDEEIEVIGNLEKVIIRMTKHGNLEIEYTLPRSGKGKKWCPAENREEFIDSQEAPSKSIGGGNYL